MYLTCQEGNSNKFYEIKLEGTDVLTRYGKIGTDGVSGTKSFSSAAEAQKFIDKTVREKTNKGYALAANSSLSSSASGAVACASSATAAKGKNGNCAVCSLSLFWMFLLALVMLSPS